MTHRYLLFVALLGCGSTYPAYSTLAERIGAGDAAFEKGEFRRAAHYYDRAIELDASNVSAQLLANRATIYIVFKQPVRCLRFLDGHETRATAIALVEIRASCLWEAGRRIDAVATAERVVTIDPKRFTSQLLIANFNASRDPARAVRAYDGYFACRPEALAAHDSLPSAQLGLALVATGDHERAIDVLTKLRLTKRPGLRATADNGLCASHVGNGEFDRAIAVCERLIEDPRALDRTGSVWLNLAVACLAKRQPRKARMSATEYMLRRKSDPRGYAVVGDSYWWEWECDKALDFYAQAQALKYRGESARLPDAAALAATCKEHGPPPDTEALQNLRGDIPAVPMLIVEHTTTEN